MSVLTSIELEAKLAIASHDPIRVALGGLGATCQGLVCETNTFLDTPGRTLVGGDVGLRIRRNHWPDGRGPDELVVTYKGPKLPGPYKSREEIEFTVSDHDALLTLFSRLGYQVTLSFEKRRETWTLTTSLGPVEIVLDTLPPVLRHSTLLEVEAQNEHALRHALELLSLSHLPPLTVSYSDLIAAHLQSRPGQTAVNFTST